MNLYFQCIHQTENLNCTHVTVVKITCCPFKGLGHAILGNFVGSKLQIGRARVFICKITATKQLRMIFQLCK